MISIDKKDLENLIFMADNFRDVAMNSYYATDTTLQEYDSLLDNLIEKLKTEGKY